MRACVLARALSIKLQAASNKLQASSSKRFKLQAASIKPQAQRLKLKAASNKLLDPGSFKKFQAPLIKGLYQDKGVVRVAYMERYLVW